MKPVIRSCCILCMVLSAAVPLFSEESGDAGEVLLLGGRVLDTGGVPVRGAVVELWQADRNGNYNHPADSSPADLLEDFQYFGTALTGTDGSYVFRTARPSPYGGRPAHLHFKVKLGGEELLTSQFYFPEDRNAVGRDPVARSGGGSLFLEPVPGSVSGSGDVREFTADIVVDRNGTGSGPRAPTPAQTEGPYYPVTDFSRYDNDLTDPGTGRVYASPEAPGR